MDLLKRRLVTDGYHPFDRPRDEPNFTSLYKPKVGLEWAVGIALGLVCGAIVGILLTLI